MVKKNACVFISGKGTNLKNLLLKSRSYNFPVKFKLVVCNKKNVGGIKIAKKNSIPIYFINTKSRLFEINLLRVLIEYKISIICLAGYMKIISKFFLNSFGKKVINIHPSLLPKYKGLNTFSRVLKNKERKTGCTVHYVNENLDSGKIILQKSFFIDEKDNEENLKIKTQKLEHLSFPEALIKIYRKF